MHVRGADNSKVGAVSQPAREASAYEGLPSNETIRTMQAISAASGLPWLVLSDSVATQVAVAGRLRDFGLRIASRPCGLPAHPNPNASSDTLQTLAVLQDFFALTDSAGCVAVAGHGKGRTKGRSFPRSESSFVTVAALAGDVPLLTPVPFARAGAMARYELLGNRGQPLRNVFFLEDLVAFIRALGDPTLRHRPANQVPESFRGRTG